MNNPLKNIEYSLSFAWQNEANWEEMLFEYAPLLQNFSMFCSKGESSSAIQNYQQFSIEFHILQWIADKKEDVVVNS